MNLPSVRTLSQLTDRAKELRTLLETRKHDQALVDLVIAHYPNTLTWLNACHNRPRNVDIVLHAADELLGTFGVEAVADRHYPGFDGPLVVEYLNTGDTYTATLLYFPASGRFAVGSWGDVVERLGI